MCVGVLCVMCLWAQEKDVSQQCVCVYLVCAVCVRYHMHVGYEHPDKTQHSELVTTSKAHVHCDAIHNKGHNFYDICSCFAKQVLSMC